jgi:hypothetical protein
MLPNGGGENLAASPRSPSGASDSEP